MKFIKKKKTYLPLKIQIKIDASRKVLDSLKFILFCFFKNSFEIILDESFQTRNYKPFPASATSFLSEDSVFFRKEYYIYDSKDYTQIKYFCDQYQFSSSEKIYDFLLIYFNIICYDENGDLPMRSFWKFEYDKKLNLQRNP